MGAHTEELYRQVLPLHGPDPDGLAHDIVAAWAFGAEEVDELVRETPEGSGWSIIFDVDAVPGKGLPWLAQVRGVKLPPKRADQTVLQWESDARFLIRNASARDRGTPAALRAAILLTLVGSNPYVKITERVGNNAYQLAVRTLTAETPSTAVTLAAAKSQVPGGVVLDYQAVAGQSWSVVAGSFTDWTAARAGYRTWGDMEANLP